ncbi:hypothetical protein PCL1606_20300 [Pseudomonas chlororaphis]|uniref:Uncharacterized protein n=1 Tax=Pseudomonas chlororaphis TaxID=587753 RepID=A0A0D5XWM1_9PSED|nr:hypothetical protein PCL1606_20300 [Pseudomonas chlororaphis]
MDANDNALLLLTPDTEAPESKDPGAFLCLQQAGVAELGVAFL